MLQGHIVVLDTQLASQRWAVIAGDIAGSVDAWGRLQVFVDEHAVINAEPGGSGQLSVRGDAHPNGHQIGFELSPGVRHHGAHAALFAHKMRRRRVGEHRDTLLAQERLDKAARLGVEHYDVALQHGRVAGTNMTGGQRSYTELPYFFSHMGPLHIDVIGDMSRRQQSVRRGALSLEPGFTQFYFADDLLQAVLCINGEPALFQAARERVAERRPVSDPAAFADEGRELAAL